MVKIYSVALHQRALVTIWLNNTQLFGLRGRQEHRDMTWGDVERNNKEGTTFLEYNERQARIQKTLAL